MPRTTRDRLIHAAYELLMQHGIAAVGIDQIIGRVGVTKSTFYNHFESKEDLVLAVLRWQDRQSTLELRSRLRALGGDRPRDQLLAMVEHLDEVFHTSGQLGCVFFAAATEYPMAHHPIQLEVRSHVRSVWSMIRELAGYAGAEDPKALADELALLVAGAYTMGQLGDRAASRQTAQRMAAQTINIHVPERPQGSRRRPGPVIVTLRPGEQTRARRSRSMASGEAGVSSRRSRR